jgi:hypothetical protein
VVVMDEEEAAGPMPLIGTLQVDGLVQIESLQDVLVKSAGVRRGLSSGALEKTALRGRIRGSAVTTCHNKSCMH